jgi:hypothetical protein
MEMLWEEGGLRERQEKRGEESLGRRGGDDLLVRLEECLLAVLDLLLSLFRLHLGRELVGFLLRDTGTEKKGGEEAVSAGSVNGGVDDGLKERLERDEELVVSDNILLGDGLEEVPGEVDEVGLAGEGRLGDGGDEDVAVLLRQVLDGRNGLRDVLDGEELEEGKEKKSVSSAYSEEKGGKAHLSHRVLRLALSL